MDEIRAFRTTDQLGDNSAKHYLKQKVCSLFSKLLQAVQSFSRNMIGDVGLDKLQIFLQTLHDALNMCVDERVFEHNDMLIKVCAPVHNLCIFINGIDVLVGLETDCDNSHADRLH